MIRSESGPPSPEEVHVHRVDDIENYFCRSGERNPFCFISGGVEVGPRPDALAGV
jgi:hypothetical protein